MLGYANIGISLQNRIKYDIIKKVIVYYIAIANKINKTTWKLIIGNDELYNLVRT